MPTGLRPPLAWDDIDTDASPHEAEGAIPPGDVDEVAIERAIAGEGIRYDDSTPAEQDHVNFRLTEHG